jgi:hypothetical protein
VTLERRPATIPTTGLPLSDTERVAARRRLVAAQEREAARFEAVTRRRVKAGRPTLETYQARAAKLRAVGAKTAGRRT